MCTVAAKGPLKLWGVEVRWTLLISTWDIMSSLWESQGDARFPHYRHDDDVNSGWTHRKLTQTRLLKCQPAPPIFCPSSIHPSLSVSLYIWLLPSLPSLSPPSPMIRLGSWITQRELFIDQDSRGSSSPHRASMHSDKTHCFIVFF